MPASVAQWGERRITAPTGGESPGSSRSARWLFAPGGGGGWPAVSGSDRITGQMKSVSSTLNFAVFPEFPDRAVEVKTCATSLAYRGF